LPPTPGRVEPTRPPARPPAGPRVPCEPLPARVKYSLRKSRSLLQGQREPVVCGRAGSRCPCNKNRSNPTPPPPPPPPSALGPSCEPARGCVDIVRTRLVLEIVQFCTAIENFPHVIAHDVEHAVNVALRSPDLAVRPGAPDTAPREGTRGAGGGGGAGGGA